MDFADTLFSVRDAAPADTHSLGAIKYGERMHGCRIAVSDGRTLRYLVAELSEEIIGFACLVPAQPTSWPSMSHLPQIVDLTIREDHRGKGLGTKFIGVMETLTHQAGHNRLFIAVAPERNPRAHRLYARLGYCAIETEPLEDRWEYVDSEGVWRAGVERVIHMRKEPLSPPRES
ncbi:MAG: GNAT family N-acetyltransferase [Chitinivibrionales bacterium]|nr:GNAT family N-acetyltransferase [Chitinivibrionales bacterium]